jgi:hypothetical protein
MDMGIPIISTIRNIIIKLITARMIRNDQKFFAEALKNSEELNLPADPLRLLNNPPVKKVLRINPTIIAKRNPVEKNEVRLFNVATISVKTSILIPSVSFSVIILLPKAEFKAPFIGRTTKLTRKRDVSHMISTPFQRFRELRIPFLIAMRIFIIRWL